MCRKNKEKVVSRNSSQKAKFGPLETRAIALDEAKCAKYMASFKQEELKIQAWKKHEKRKPRLGMKRMEHASQIMIDRVTEQRMLEDNFHQIAGGWVIGNQGDLVKDIIAVIKTEHEEAMRIVLLLCCWHMLFGDLPMA